MKLIANVSKLMTSTTYLWFESHFLTWNWSVPTRATGVSFPLNSANNGVVSDALFEHFNVNSEMNAI